MLMKCSFKTTGLLVNVGVRENKSSNILSTSRRRAVPCENATGNRLTRMFCISSNMFIKFYFLSNPEKCP